MARRYQTSRFVVRAAVRSIVGSGVRHVALALIGSLVVTGGCRSPSPTPVAASAPPPRLVVMLVIDQWPSWGLTARRSAYRAGIDRLLREGTVFDHAIYPYAITFTAPGHAALGTGAPPSVTGIVANSWYRRSSQVERAAEFDPASAILGIDGASIPSVDGASSVALRVDGVAESLRAATGGRGRSVAIAGKARAACFVAGRRPDVVLWYEPAARAMTTSSAYGSIPSWAVPLGQPDRMATPLRSVWALTDPEVVGIATGISDDGRGESDPRFPHDLAASHDPAKEFKQTPFLDTLEVDTAIAAITGESLGADDIPDLLAVSFSSHDYAGHQWGQESWEMFDLERRLDREIGRLLEVLDVRIGIGNYAVIVTSDHGATRMPELTGGYRIAPADIEAVAEAAATTVLGEGEWIASVSSAMIYGRPALTAAPQRNAAITAIERAVDAMPGVHAVLPMPGRGSDCRGLDDPSTRVCLSTVVDESGELLVWPDDGSLVTNYPTGTSHDAPSDDDRTVPIIVRAAGWPSRVDSTPVSALSVAATVAALLRIPSPPAATAPALTP
jgi:arylsulfatase A-like enzyme